MSGYGVYQYANGDKYEGSFNAGYKSGRGKYTAADGGVFVGEYLLDKRHGRGTYKYPDGRLFEGVWEDDRVKDEIQPVVQPPVHGAKQRRGVFAPFSKAGKI